jgi:hypothetical protein
VKKNHLLIAAMPVSKDDILVYGLMGVSLAAIPFVDDRTKTFLQLLMIGAQFGIQVPSADSAICSIVMYICMILCRQ